MNTTMNTAIRQLSHASAIVAIALGLHLGASLVQPASAQAGGSPSSAELQMPQEAAAFRRVAEAFVASAMAGDSDRVMAALSPAVVARAGEAQVRGMLEQRIVPFFRAARAEAGEATLGRSVTITHTTDASGNRGFAFYAWASPREGGAARPFTVYLVQEAGRIVVANIVPDRLVEGRHR